MGNHKNYFIVILLLLSLVLGLFQNCAEPIDESLFEERKIPSLTETQNTEEQEEEELQIDVYTMPDTIVSVGTEFIIVADVLSGQKGFTYKFKKNQRVLLSAEYEDGQRGQTGRTKLNFYNEKDLYSVEVYKGDTLIESRNLKLNAHKPVEQEPEEPDNGCSAAQATAHKNLSTSGAYTYTWLKPADTKYIKIELMSDKETEELEIVRDIYIRTNYTLVNPGNRETSSKTSVRYQLLTTCEDGSQSYSNIITLNLNN